MLAALVKRSTRLLEVSATQRVPVLSTATPWGELSVFAFAIVPRLLALLMKLNWPRTPSAGSPLSLVAALAKRSTRWLEVSATQRVPVMSTVTPKGAYSVVAATVALRLLALLMKSAWPRTPSAGSPLSLVAALAKRSTRLLEVSATQREPVLSTTTPAG